MGRRQQQHLGRSTDEPGDIAGRDHQQDPVVHDETIAKIEEAKDVSRAIDHSEGYDREGPKKRTVGPSGGGRKKNR